MIPSWYFFALLALAAFRVWKLIGNDAILDVPRRFAKKRLERIDPHLDLFIVCPWCSGFWVCVAVYTGWIAWGPGFFEWGQVYLAFVVVFALSAVVGLLAGLLPDEDD